MCPPFVGRRDFIVSKFDDYLNGVDLSEGLPETFITDIRNAYNHDLSIPASKVESLNSAIAERDAMIGNLNSQLSDVKATNWDLVNQLPPSDDGNEYNNDTSESKPIDFDDLFQ